MRIFIGKVDSIVTNELNILMREKKEVLRKRQKFLVRKYGKSFYTTIPWLALKDEALRKYKRKCAACGSKKNLQVDHIKPRSRYPELEFCLDNLQILCQPCNKEKGNCFIIDFREKPLVVEEIKKKTPVILRKKSQIE